MDSAGNLNWKYDADKYGDFIKNKHKGELEILYQ
jgi:hypothetical protein